MPSKTPADPTQVKSIVDRIKKVQESFGPKGLPKQPENVTETSSDFPLQRNTPKDPGWQQTTMITGSGGGPELHNVSLVF